MTSTDAPPRCVSRGGCCVAAWGSVRSGLGGAGGGCRGAARPARRHGAGGWSGRDGHRPWSGPRPAPSRSGAARPGGPPDRPRWPARGRPAAARGWSVGGSCGRPARQALSPPAPQPLGGRGHRDPLGLGRLDRRPTLLQHPLHQQSPARHRQLRPRMGHESLPAWSLSRSRHAGSHPQHNLSGNHT
jgi:hypothetical protein